MRIGFGKTLIGLIKCVFLTQIQLYGWLTNCVTRLMHDDRVFFFNAWCFIEIKLPGCERDVDIYGIGLLHWTLSLKIFYWFGIFFIG